MKKFSLKLSFVVSLLLLVNSVSSQVGVTGYSVYAVGVNTSVDKTISGELKLFTNTSLRYSELELDLFYNFDPGQYHRFSLGLGLNTYPFQGYEPLNSLVMPLQLQIFPLKDFKRLSLLLEIAPEMNFETKFYVRNLIGARYTFGGENAE